METRLERAQAFRLLWRAVVVALALTSLLVPRNGIWSPLYSLIFGVPLILTAARPKAAQSFRLWVMYIMGFVLFVVVRNIADDLHAPVGFTYIIRFEQAICMGAVPSEVLQRLFHAAGRIGPVEVLAVGVYMSYFVVPPLVLFGLWAWNPVAFRCYVAASLMVFLVAALTHLLLPTAPPWLAAQQGYLAGHVEPILKTFFHMTPPPIYQYGAARMAENHVAAMPSVHMAVTWLVVLACRATGSRIAAVGLGYAALMGVAIVYLGDHYVADALAGVVLASLSWWGVHRLFGAGQHDSGSRQSRSTCVLGAESTTPPAQEART